MGGQNMQDLFREGLSHSEDFPINNTLIRSARPHQMHRRQEHFEYLQQNNERLFKGSNKSRIRFLEAGRSSDLEDETVKTMDELASHLDTPENDPMIRHAFIEAQSSRKPLNCPADMFKYLLTFHQVDASFLDSVYTLGKQDEPLDLCLSTFSSHDTLMTPNHERLVLPQRGRSGHELHMSYLIRSVERTRPGSGVWDWRIRPTAVCHSFDVDNGRSFWLTVKGNDHFHKRIEEAHEFLRPPTQVLSQDQTVQAYFQASLATHLLYLSWCDENWRQFVNEFEAAVEEVLEKARSALIDDHLKDGGSELFAYPRSVSFPRKNTMNPRGTQRVNSNIPAPGIEKQNSWDRLKNVVKSLPESFVRRPSKVQSDEEKAETSDEDVGEPLVDPREVLDQFRLGDIQKLHRLNHEIERALLTIRLNCETLEAISSYYDRLTVESGFFSSPTSRTTVKDFVSQVHFLSRSLQVRRMQLEHLTTEISKGITLYDGILQYRNLDINQTFLENSDDTARKTSRQSTSMHIITIFTLIFLPATFVAVRMTLAQSGIFMWNDAENITGRYEVSGDGVKLFFKICIPLMAITLGAWAFTWARDGNRRRLVTSLRWKAWKGAGAKPYKLRGSAVKTHKLITSRG